MLNYSNIKKTNQKSVTLQTILCPILPPHLLFLFAFPCSYMYWARLHLHPCPVRYCCAKCIAFSLPTLLSCGLPSCSTLYPHFCLPSLFSLSNFTCYPTHLSLHFILPHVAPASSLIPIISQSEALLLHLSLLLNLFLSSSLSICSLLFAQSQCQPLRLPLLHSQKTSKPHISVWMLKLFALVSSTAPFISHFNHSLWLAATLALKKSYR